MAAKFPQEISSMHDKSDVSLQVRAELSETNKASVAEYCDGSTNSADENNGLPHDGKKENVGEVRDRHGDGVNNDEKIPPPQDEDFKIGVCNKISSNEWEQLKQKISVRACLENYCVDEVRLAILELVREKGYFPAGTKAADIAELI